MKTKITKEDTVVRISTLSGQGQDGNTPYIENGTWWIDGVDTGIKAVAEDGLTPTIGANGNWFVGDVDTEIPAQGQNGKSAYQIWLDADNEGSEQDFIEFLKGNDGAPAPIPEFRTYYPPPVIDDASISTSVTDSFYTTNFNEATQQPGVFQWKYTNEPDSEWRDQYPVPALPGPLEYFLVEGTIEQLSDPVLIQQLTPVASGLDTNQLSGTGSSDNNKYATVYVKDQAGNIAIYDYELIIFPDPKIDIITATPSQITGDEGESGVLSWVVEGTETTPEQELATPTSTDTNVVTLSNIDKNAGTADYQLVTAGNANINIVADLDGTTTQVAVSVAEVVEVTTNESDELIFDAV